MLLGMVTSPQVLWHLGGWMSAHVYCRAGQHQPEKCLLSPNYLVGSLSLSYPPFQGMSVHMLFSCNGQAVCNAVADITVWLKVGSRIHVGWERPIPCARTTLCITL
jgi:hypothetical protein